MYGVAPAPRCQLSGKFVGQDSVGDDHATAAVDSAGEGMPTHSGQLEDPPDEGCGSRPERPAETARPGIPAQLVHSGLPSRFTRCISGRTQAVEDTSPVALSLVGSHQGGARTLDDEVHYLLALLAKML